MSEIVNQIRAFKEHYQGQKLFERKGESLNQHDTVDLIDKYWDSKFLLGDVDEDGIYKFFYNIVKFPTRVGTHRTDFDTKDIRAIAEDGQPYVPVWLLNQELKSWMKEQSFGLLLNELSAKLPKYGNVVFKTKDGNIKSVNIKNLSNDAYVSSLEDSYVVIERHYMNPRQLQKQKGWDREVIDEILLKLSSQGTRSRAVIDESYIYAKDGYDVVRKLVIIAGLDDYELDSQGNAVKDESKILFEDKVDELPYYEFFWDEYSGNWLREGVVLELMEDQMKVNEVTNLQGKGFHWTNKKLYQTKDMTVAKNIFYGVRNGDILRVSSEITPVANEERNLASFREEIRNWDENVRRKSFSFESITGETMPSGTPFRLGFIQQQAGGGYYDQKKETIGLLLKKLIVEVIIPTFQSKSRKQHIFNLHGEDNDISRLEELLVEFNLYNEVQTLYSRTGNIPTDEEVVLERQRALAKLRADPQRKIDVPDGFYQDLKYRIDIVTTNESVALDSKLQTLTTALQTIATNPGILQNETLRKIFFKILDYAGISPEEFRQSSQQQLPMEMMQTFSPPPAPAGLKPELQTGATETKL